jgi:hypothetical protein
MQNLQIEKASYNAFSGQDGNRDGYEVFVRHGGAASI